MKASTLTNQKIWPMYKFLRTKQTDGRTEKWTGPKLHTPDILIQGHKKVAFFHKIRHENSKTKCLPQDITDPSYSKSDVIFSNGWLTLVDAFHRCMKSPFHRAWLKAKI